MKKAQKLKESFELKNGVTTAAGKNNKMNQIDDQNRKHQMNFSTTTWKKFNKHKKFKVLIVKKTTTN